MARRKTPVRKLIRKQKIRSRRRGGRVPLGFLGFLALTAKIFCLFTFLGVAVLLGCAGWRFVADSDYFTLKQLVIQGVSDERAAELRIKTLPDPKRSVNLLLLDSDKVRATLLDHSEIAPESVKITKRYPNTLIIRARERTPVAVVACGALYLIDKDGYVLDMVTNLEGEQLRFPFITGVKEGEIEFGQAIPREGVRTALDLSQCLPSRLARELSEIRVGQDEGLTLMLSGGVEVRMGRSDVAERLAALELFMKKESGRLDRFEYIDLRFSDQIVYRMRNT